MAGKFHYTYEGARSIGDRFRNLADSQEETVSGIASTIRPLTKYFLTNDNYVDTNAHNFDTGSLRNISKDDQIYPFDPTYDPQLSYTVPQSGMFAIAIQLYMQTSVSVWTPQNTQNRYMGALSSLSLYLNGERTYDHMLLVGAATEGSMSSNTVGMNVSREVRINKPEWAGQTIDVHTQRVISLTMLQYEGSDETSWPSGSAYNSNWYSGVYGATSMNIRDLYQN